MKIPEKLKVGGVIYDVEITDNIPLGESCLGETDFDEAKIRLRPIAPPVMARIFWHEVLHALLYDLGYAGDHDEKEVDELAGALYALVVDNPVIFLPSA